MLVRTVMLVLSFATAGVAARGEGPGLAFRQAGPGLYDFDTGSFKGRLKVDGRYQGLYPLIDVATGEDLTHPPGVFSLYRVFSTGTRYGDGARDWPTTTELCSDGAVAVDWAAAPEHPLQIRAVYRWSAADTLDLEVAVTPQKDLPDFELFLSSYFTKQFLASAYVTQEGPDGGGRFLPVDRHSESKGGYVMFPRDDQALKMIFDGRWAIPPSPVAWDVGDRLAAPVVLRRDATTGITVLMMTPPQATFAVSSPWNPDTPEAAGYRSLYLSLFGRDLTANEEARVRCRLVVGREITDRRAEELYKTYVDQYR